ncbi:MAG TPA: hypothetical protein VMW15_08915 [Terracidiphilus sp.]|nr:hypothetical protein [Terracidiphilus sp.]
MEAIQENITEPAQTAPVDLNAVRANVATLRAQIEEQERVIAAEELRQAEERHAPLLEQCRTLQERFDTLDKQVEAQTHVLYQAVTRRNGAAQALDTERRNPPIPRWDGGRPDRADAQGDWQARITKCLKEQKTADAAVAPVQAELTRLQGEKRIASERLVNLSWEESYCRDTIAGWKQKLKKLVPASGVDNWYEREIPDSGVITVAFGRH